MERDRHWIPNQTSRLPTSSSILDPRSRLARERLGLQDEVRHLHLRPKDRFALSAFAPDVVVAGGGGIWSSPANIATLAARRRKGWAVVPWWGSFTVRTPRGLGDSPGPG